MGQNSDREMVCHSFVSESLWAGEGRAVLGALRLLPYRQHFRPLAEREVEALLEVG